MYLISSACSSHYFVFLSLYILSPIDLIPECIFGLLGFIDDIFVVAALLVVISNFYYNLIYRRDREHHLNNNSNEESESSIQYNSIEDNSTTTE